MMRPYAASVASTVNLRQREIDKLNTLKDQRVDLKGFIVKAISEFLDSFGGATTERIATECGLPVLVVQRCVNAMRHHKIVVLSAAYRDRTFVELA